MVGADFLQSCKVLVEHRLEHVLPAEQMAPARLHQAMRYAVLGGGKRLRPALGMAAAESLGQDPTIAIGVGCAAELVHCFSLIHDDLPAIDDDSLRRGRPTVHKQFDEATAILAGDALFALAFQTLSEIESPTMAALCLKSLALATGSRGLVGGEVLDIQSEGSPPDLPLVESIHRQKTGALMSSACEMGGVVAGGTREEVAALAVFGMEVGLSFQIIDDVLNETGESDRLGKQAGSDRQRKKLTYPAVMGVERSLELAKETIDAAVVTLGSAISVPNTLTELAVGIVERDR